MGDLKLRLRFTTERTESSRIEIEQNPRKRKLNAPRTIYCFLTMGQNGREDEAPRPRKKTKALLSRTAPPLGRLTVATKTAGIFDTLRHCSANLLSTVYTMQSLPTWYYSKPYTTNTCARSRRSDLCTTGASAAPKIPNPNPKMNIRFSRDSVSRLVK
eukprot:IDg8263t1